MRGKNVTTVQMKFTVDWFNLFIQHRWNGTSRRHQLASYLRVHLADELYSNKTNFELKKLLFSTYLDKQHALSHASVGHILQDYLGEAHCAIWRIAYRCSN